MEKYEKRKKKIEKKFRRVTSCPLKRRNYGATRWARRVPNTSEHNTQLSVCIYNIQHK